MTCLDWLKIRFPSFSFGEINFELFLESFSLTKDSEFSDETKENCYRAYVESLKKLLLTYSSVSEEGTSISLDKVYIKSEIAVYSNFLPEEMQPKRPDILNAGEYD